MTIPEAPDVAGLSLDGGIHIIDPDENRTLCRSLGIEPEADGRAHPAYFFIATQVGMGLSVAGLCAACNFNIEDGPMIGSCDVTFFSPLMTGEPYRVKGEIVSVTRKQSRKFGAMDILQYALRLERPDGGNACSVTNTWILPRGHADVH